MITMTVAATITTTTVTEAIRKSSSKRKKSRNGAWMTLEICSFTLIVVIKF